MQCTPEEIERKRRLAREKLAMKMNGTPSPSKQNQNLSNNFNSNFLNSSGSLSGSSVGQTYNNNFSNSSRTFSGNSVGQNYQNKSPFKFKHVNSFGSPKKPYDKPVDKPILDFYGKDGPIKLTCRIVSDERFAVDMSAFNTYVLDCFKEVPSRNYDPKTRVWSFSLNNYDMLLTKLQQRLSSQVVIEKLPHFVVKLLNTPKTNSHEVDLSKIDEQLNSALMPFQVEGVLFGIEKQGRCLIADDMGLGKTFQALAIANYYKEDWPLLIVTTASMKNTWESTIHTFLPSVSVMHTQYMEKTKDYIGECRVLILSYDLMSRALDKISSRNFGVIILDESHTLKNFKTKCTKAADSLCRNAKRVILLSGTPALSRPSELYTQLSMIDNKFFGTFFDYSKRYCDGKSTNFGWDATGKSNLQELEIVLAKKFMIRRTKDQVLQAMPNKVQTVVNLDLGLEKLQDKDKECLEALARHYSDSTKSCAKHSALLSYFSETARIKIPAVCTYIIDVLNSASSKFLVFAHHKIVLDALEKILKSKNKKFIRIDGNTSSDQRKFFVDKFQIDNNYVCALLSITAANAGITLTAANLVIFAELHWNPSILMQAESRAHRIGQSEVVHVRYLIGKGTADDHIWPMLNKKQKILEEVGLSKDSFTNVSVDNHEVKSDSSYDLNMQLSNSQAKLTTMNFFTTSPVKSERVVKQTEESQFDEDDIFNDGLDDILSNIDM